MIFLLDTNVLLALVWENHDQHVIASEWLMGIGADRWATCPFTECGFVRLASNPKVVKKAAKPGEAIELLAGITRHPSHDFWPATVEISQSPRFPRSMIQGYLQVADAYLFALSLENGGRLVTFDRGIPSLARNQSERDSVVLLTS